MTIDKQQLIDAAHSAIMQHPNQQIVAKLTVTMDVLLTTKAKFETIIRELRGAKVEGCDFQVGIQNPVEIVEPEKEDTVANATQTSENVDHNSPGCGETKVDVSEI